MPRNPKRKPNARAYKTKYTNQDLADAISAVRGGVKKSWKAAKDFRIPFGTLINKLKDLHPGKPGRRTVFSVEEEASIVSAISALGDWSFPLTPVEIRLLAKNFLDQQGRVVDRFPNNLPGRDWVTSFLKRHKNEIKVRIADNLSRARAELSPDDVKKFFTNLGKELEGVPPTNIINYDETNLTDDTGRKRCVFRRSCRYPNRVAPTTKTGFSVMFSGSADGIPFPPYTVFKAEHLYTPWVEGGPKGARYNRSKSGWFDTECFEDWFLSLMLPRLKRLPGKKVLIGDNLSSHFSHRVITEARKNDIHFVFLPSNSTHLQQPLDVAFFAPLKRIWRKILSEFKVTQRNKGSIQKADFPGLLRNLVNDLTETGKGSMNLKAGFEACGIYPINAHRVLQKLPGGVTRQSSDCIIADVVEKMLAPQRYGENGVGTSSQRRKPAKRMKVVPGKSVGNAQSNSEASEAEEHVNRINDERMYDDHVESNEQDLVEPNAEAVSDHIAKVESIIDLATGDVVAAIWESKWWVGKVINLSVINDDAEISFMHPVGESRLLYRWPEIPDELFVKIPDVLCKLKGAMVQKRGRKRSSDYEMEETCLDEIESVFLSRIRKPLPLNAY
jgi:hypothetical protein